MPLQAHTIGGVVCPFPLLTLRVRDRYGGFVPIRFRIDTGADVTTIPVTKARNDRISFREGQPGRAQGLAGVVGLFRGRIHVLIAGRGYDWPCNFLQAPAVQGQGLGGQELPPVLGRAGFLEDFAFCLDDEHFTLTRQGTWRRWWRHRCSALWSSFGLLHEPTEPL